MRSPIVTRNVLSATVGRPSTRSSASATLAPREIERPARRRQRLGAPGHARRLAEHELERDIDGRRAAALVGEPSAGHRASRCRAAPTARARARTAPRTRRADPARSPSRSAPALRCTTARAATGPARRSESCAARASRRGRRRGRARASRSRGRPRRRRGSTGSGSASPSAQQRSITSWQRRSISALSRCTDAKSRSSADAPCASELAAPPPRPIRNAGPPSTIERGTGGTGAFCDVHRRASAPMPPASMTGL